MKFEERAVAFIDILGFKALVNDAVQNPNSLYELDELIKLLESAVPTFDEKVEENVPRHLVPKYLYISDCIIISAPLSDENMLSYNGLEIVIMRVIQLTHHFLSKGYLIRGGISVGKVWHTNSNIIGPAYHEAYLLEAQGNEPIVKLSDAASSMQLWSSRMRLKHDGLVFVNGLNEFYIPNNTEHGAIEATYDKYANNIENALNKGLPDSARQKWEWFKAYLEAETSEKSKWQQA